MKKQNTDIQDIYRTGEEIPEQVSAREKTSEYIDQEIRRRRIFTLLAALLTLALAVFLTSSMVKEYLTEPAPEPAAGKTPYFPVYTLPNDDQWTLEYRQIAEQADRSEPPGPKNFSSKWVKNAAYHVIMGQQALQMNELPAAQAHLEAAIETFPQMTGVRAHLGLVYLKRQYFQKAAEQLKKALEEQPDIAVFNNLGAAYIGTGEYGQAELFLKKALQERPELAGGWKNLALLYRKTGRTDEAGAAFEKYFALNPGDTEFIQTYIDYLMENERTAHAIDFLEQINGADSRKVCLLLARTAARNQDTDRAVRALQEAARFLTPRQVIVEMHDAAFEKIAGTEPFEKLLYRLELAAVSLSTNFTVQGESGN